jgi:hypothetical protein
MTYPSCPRCGQPLRWFPEQYAWGCDTCRQMMPAATGAPVAQAAPRGSRTALWIALGALVVGGGIVVAVVASSGGRKEYSAGGGSESASGGGAVATGSAAPVEPAIPSTGIAECDKVAALRPKIEACAAISVDTRTTALQMADNNLSGAEGATGEYAEYVRPKCAGTAAFLADTLAEAGCAPRARAQATGFSVPIPSGWEVIRENGQLPTELILEQRLPDIGVSQRAGIYLELAPYSDKANATGTDANCKSFAEYDAPNHGATLDEQGLDMQVNLQGKHILGATCSYDLAASTHPVGCVEIVDGLTLD